MLKYIIIGWMNWNASQNEARHLEGYFEMEHGARLHQLRRWFPRAHFEPRRGLLQPEQARDYCKREHMWRERGQLNSDRRPRVLEVD